MNQLHFFFVIAAVSFFKLSALAFDTVNQPERPNRKHLNLNLFNQDGHKFIRIASLQEKVRSPGAPTELMRRTVAGWKIRWCLVILDCKPFDADVERALLRKIV